MTDEAQLTTKLWKALKSDMTVMLGLSGVDEGHSQPMTAQLDDESERGGPIWFFTAKDTDLVGAMVRDQDRATIDRLWNRFVAAWFEGGKEDPKLQLLRFEPEQGQVWLNEHSLFAGIKLLLGRDPKAEYKDKVGEVRLPH
jgi:general stress protein 26